MSGLRGRRFRFRWNLRKWIQRSITLWTRWAIRWSCSGLGSRRTGWKSSSDFAIAFFDGWWSGTGYTAIALESSFPRGPVVDDYVVGIGKASSYDDVQESGFNHNFARMAANRELVEWMRRTMPPCRGLDSLLRIRQPDGDDGRRQSATATDGRDRLSRERSMRDGLPAIASKLNRCWGTMLSGPIRLPRSMRRNRLAVRRMRLCCVPRRKTSSASFVCGDPNSSREAKQVPTPRRCIMRGTHVQMLSYHAVLATTFSNKVRRLSRAA